MLTNFPPQRIPFKSKDKEWRIQSVNYICSNADMQYTEDYKRMSENYSFHNNIIDQTELQKYCDPLGLDAGQGRDFIQGFNKTPNKIQILKGEELKRPWAYHIMDYSNNATNEVMREKNRHLREWFDVNIGNEIQIQKAKMEMLAQQQTQELPKNEIKKKYEEIMQQLAAREQEILNPQQIEAKFKSYRTVKEKLMAKLMKIKTHELKIKHLKNEAFFDAVVAGKEFVMVSMINGAPDVEILNTLGVAYHKGPEEEFTQNGEFITYKREMSLGEIYDRYGTNLNDDDLENLENRLSIVYGGNTKLFSRDAKSVTHFENLNTNNRFGGSANVSHSGGYGQDNSLNTYCTVYTCFWKSWREVGFLSFTDENGKPQMTIVSEEFTVPKEAKTIKVKQEFGPSKSIITWTDEITGLTYELIYEYIPQVWQGTRIDQEIFLDIKPYPYSRVSLYNPFKCKLPIFGTAYNTRNAPIVSYMDRMKPWAKLYLLLMSKLLKLIAQDKGVVVLLNLLMVDKDLDLDKTLQYATDAGYLAYNPMQNAETGLRGLVTNMKAAEALNLSNIQNIRHYTDLLRFTEDQIGDAAGISKPREGQTAGNSNVTDNRQDLIQSAVITEPIFAAHDLLWEDVLNELVYLSQIEIAESGGVSKRGILSDDEIAIIELDGTAFDPCELGAYVSNNGNANMILDQVKSNVQALIQNDKVNLSTFISLLSVEDIGEMKAEIKDLENNIAQREAQMQQSQLDSQEKQTKMMIEREEDAQNHDKEMHILDGEYSIEREQIRVTAAAAIGVKDIDVDDNGVPDFLEMEKLRIDANYKTKTNSLEERKLRLEEKRQIDDKKLKEKEIETKKKDIEAKIKIAKSRPRPK